MTAPNHIIGGYVFTGSFAAFYDVNILSDWRYMVIVFFGSLLPDIDHSKSLIGKLFLPISRWLHRHHGHRTITHSLLFLAIVIFASRFTQSLFFPSVPLSLLLSLSVISHLIFDMMTVQGVPLLYPFKKNPCVIPANPSFRLRTNSITQETSVFCFFIVASVFLQPLIVNGFWSSYNQTFSSYKHLVSQYEKMDFENTVLYCKFKTKEMNQWRYHEGVVVDASPTYLMLYDSSALSLMTGSFVVHDLEFYEARGKLNYYSQSIEDAAPEDIENLSHLIHITIYSHGRVGVLADGEVTDGEAISLTYPRDIKVLRHDSSMYVTYRALELSGFKPLSP